MKTCGTCTECCNGTLVGKAFNERFFPGKPCIAISLNKGCSRYEDRPLMCSSFSCAWLDDPDMPDWMKPEFSNAIITSEEVEGVTYMTFRESSYRKTTTEVVVYFLELVALKKAVIKRMYINNNYVNLEGEVFKGNN